MNKPQRLISKGELARRVTCARSYVYRCCSEENGLLSTALVGSQVDLNHPDAAHFCASHGYKEPDGAAIAAAARAAASKPRVLSPKAPELPVVQTQAPAAETTDPEDIGAGELLDMPLREVVARFGTSAVLKDYVNIVKALVQTRGYEEEQGRKRREYIHRVHVEQLVVHVDALQKALLADAVKNMSTRAVTQAAAGETQKQVEDAMRTVISRTIKAAKAEIDRTLRNV